MHTAEGDGLVKWSKTSHVNSLSALFLSWLYSRIIILINQLSTPTTTPNNAYNMRRASHLFSYSLRVHVKYLYELSKTLSFTTKPKHPVRVLRGIC